MFYSSFCLGVIISDGEYPISLIGIAVGDHKDGSRGNLCNFIQQNVNSQNSVVLNSTTKLSVNIIVKIPTTFIMWTPNASSAHH